MTERSEVTAWPGQPLSTTDHPAPFRPHKPWTLPKPRQPIYILGPHLHHIEDAARAAGYSRRDIHPITDPDQLRGTRDITVYVVHPSGLRDRMLNTIHHYQQTGRITFHYGPLPELAQDDQK